ncbi:MAG: hypothetical protein KIT14_16185 [bacterium]|nr:hypothetical protein [bacterium]
MVLLQYDLAGIPVPFERLVEEDARVRNAGPSDKARRSEVRAALEAGAAVVQGVGRLRLSIRNADLSEYDPTYEEFVVGALSRVPS